jgi:hypothetical protein
VCVLNAWGHWSMCFTYGVSRRFSVFKKTSIYLPRAKRRYSTMLINTQTRQESNTQTNVRLFGNVVTLTSGNTLNNILRDTKPSIYPRHCRTLTPTSHNPCSQNWSKECDNSSAFITSSNNNRVTYCARLNGISM